MKNKKLFSLITTMALVVSVFSPTSLAKANTLSNNNAKIAGTNVKSIAYPQTTTFYGIINGSNVRLRRAPGLDSSIIMFLQQNQHIKLIRACAAYVDGIYWDQIQTDNGIIGYVDFDYVIITEQIES